MKSYKCKTTSIVIADRRGINPNWQEIPADDPEIAATVYAEENGLESGDLVSVWGIGKFIVDYIYHETTCEMIQVMGR